MDGGSAPVLPFDAFPWAMLGAVVDRPFGFVKNRRDLERARHELEQEKGQGEGGANKERRFYQLNDCSRPDRQARRGVNNSWGLGDLRGTTITLRMLLEG